MSLRVRINRNPITDGFDFYVLERVDGRTQNILRPLLDGTWRRDSYRTAGGARTEPSFSFADEDARDVMTSLAEQLAQLGFTQLADAQPVVRAMQEHLVDLRAAAARTHDLAAHLAVGAITRKEP